MSEENGAVAADGTSIRGSRRLKVLYCISSFGHGRGGHFYSMQTTVQAFSKIGDVSVVNFGFLPSKVARDTTQEYTFIRFIGFDFPLAVRSFVLELKRLRPDVLHAFDADSLVFARIGAILTGLPLIYTKCGGPNPAGYFPIVGNLILYSGENLKFFRENPDYRSCDMWLLPNRVGEVRSSAEAVDKIRTLAANRFVLLRITRISRYYELSIRQAVSLLARLRREGIDAVLFIVGAVQDMAFFEQIQVEFGSEHVLFITDDDMTMNAGKIIDAADCVLGTGRGLMEAASRGKVVLTPIMDSELPILVDCSNIESFLFTNFSERNRFPESEIERNFKKFVDLINSEHRMNEHRQMVKLIYEKYFSIDLVMRTYQDIYTSVISKKRKKYWRDLSWHVSVTISKISVKFVKKLVNDLHG